MSEDPRFTLLYDMDDRYHILDHELARRTAVSLPRESAVQVATVMNWRFDLVPEVYEWVAHPT